MQGFAWDHRAARMIGAVRCRPLHDMRGGRRVSSGGTFHTKGQSGRAPFRTPSAHKDVAEFFAQVPFEHLAGCVARQDIGKNHTVRHLPFCDLAIKDRKNLLL